MIEFEFDDDGETEIGQKGIPIEKGPGITPSVEVGLSKNCDE